MNLTPRWCTLLKQAGHDAQHWLDLGGPPDAPDEDVMAAAEQMGAVVFTHDLDFGAILAFSGLAAPSVVQVRTPDPRPETIGALVIATLDRFSDEIARGAIVVIDPSAARVRLLPIDRFK